MWLKAPENLWIIIFMKEGFIKELLCKLATEILSGEISGTTAFCWLDCTVDQTDEMY